ncbi:hypothetical protein TrST_g2521 [Triparma strigata]|uniref:SPX domain-containing protein n=1 Tax=Triparma strigata TaxID=1606541 RepID=A0A9W7AIM3_9STRA|nr:hypothetical protein TrST_g2521 [Triparma strigata]
MVEFGLKLEDNKVSKWGSHYLDYERLKSLLKKIKSTMKQRDDARDKRAAKLKSLRYGGGEEGGAGMKDTSSGESGDEKEKEKEKALIKQEKSLSQTGGKSKSQLSIYDAGGGGEEPAEPQKARSNPLVGQRWTAALGLIGGGGVEKVKRGYSERKKRGDKNADESAEKVTEKTSLLRPSTPPQTYVTDARKNSNSFKDLIETSSSDLAGLAKSMAAKIIPGSGKKAKEAKYLWDLRVKRAEDDFDLKEMEFSAVLKDECRKVEEFYCKKVDEYVTRLEILEEAVGYQEKVYDMDVEEVRAHRRHKYSIADVTMALTGKAPLRPEEEEEGTALQEKRSTGKFANQTTDDDDDDDEEQMSLHLDDKFKDLLASDSIKRAILDLHRNVKLISNYSIMNYTGFVKIIKKHDKTVPESKGKFKHLCAVTRFHDAKESEKLGEKMEKMYADLFCEGNMLQARAQMLPKVGDGLQMDWSQLRFGYRLGMCAVLAVWVCWDCIWQIMVYNNQTIGGTVAFPVFRACGGVLLVHWCWGLSTFVWTRFRINYIYLFEFDPRNVNSSLGILTEAVDETLVFLLLMLLYYKSCVGAIPKPYPSGVYPFLLVLYTFKCMIFPWRMRKNLWMTLLNVVTSPFHPATFFSTYIADVVTSMIKNLQDWAWTFCYIFQGAYMQHHKEYQKHPERHWQNQFWYTNILIPLICLLPIWFRLMQCLRRYHDTGRRWPNLANAFKYSLSQTVTLFGTFHPLYMYNSDSVRVSVYADDDEAVMAVKPPVDLFQIFWIGLFVVSSCYSFAWDVFMDWGLGRKEFNWLGPRLMFPHQSWYYVAIFVDIFLRFLWVTSLVPPDSGAIFAFPNYLAALCLGAEILRRTMWGFFRLEQEHRHNTEGYRRVDFVPLHFNTGHDHKYKGKEEKRGFGVLAEVLTVGAVVVGISVASIVAAQRQSHGNF